MPTIIRQILAVAALIALAPFAYGQDNVTAIEIAQLPPFCKGQYVPDVRGDEYGIRDCGPAANHFCPALIYIIRARGSVQKQARLALLGHADVDVRYTEKAIADFPKCSIREEVAGTRAQLNSLLTMYGFKRPRAQ